MNFEQSSELRETNRRLRDENEVLAGRILELERQMKERTTDLERQRERLRVTLESIGDAVITADASGRVTFLNPVACSLTGWTSEQAAGVPLEEVFHIVHEDDRQPVENPAVRVLAEGVIVGLANHTILIARDGSERPIDDSAAPILDTDGNIQGVVLVFRDISTRRQAENELAARTKEADRNRRLYEAALSNTPDLVYIFDLEHRFTYVNEGLLTMWGRTREDALGKNCLELGYEPWHAAMHSREIEQVIATRRPIKGEVPFSGTFGRRDYEYIFVPVFGENGEVEAVAGTTRDVTERRQDEERVRRNEQRFRSLMEQAPVSIQLFSPDGVTLRVNRAWEELWGLTVDQLRDYNVLQDPQLAAKGVRPYLQRAFGGESVEIPAIEYDPNETIPDRTRHPEPKRWVSAAAYPLKDPAGVVQEVVLIHQDVTARRRAQEELERSERQSRTILESVTDAFIAVDPQWRLTYVNGQAERIYGIRRDALVGGTLWDLFPDAVGSPFEAPYRRAMAERVPIEVQAPYEPLGAWFEVRVYPSGDGGLTFYFRDVSERKKSEAELARITAVSEQQRRIYETALSNTPDFNYVFDLGGRFIYVNKASLDLWGKTLDEAVGKNFFDLDYPPDLAARLQRQIQDVIDSRRSVKDEASYASRLGERQYEYIFVPVFAESGHVEAVVGSTRDITDRKQAEEGLRASVRLYRAIGESIDYGVWVCDPEGRNLYASESFLRLVGITQTQCSSYGWGDVLHPDDAEGTLAAWRDCVRTGSTWDREHRFRGVDGGWHPILARGVPVRNDGGEITAWAGINLDIASLKDVEEKLRDADRRKDEFLAMLAHELRNPLAPIRSGLDLLAMSETEESETIELMRGQVEHLVHLVDDLLDVSRIMRGKIRLRQEPVEVAALIRDSVGTVQPLFDSLGHQLALSLPTELLWVEGDRVRLIQSLCNVLANAAKYTEGNGRIELTARKNGDDVSISVRDTGIGIDSELLPRIFDLFTQADRSLERSQGGLGIGLTVVKSLVEMHGGKVSARSEGLGRGAEFEITLPSLKNVATSVDRPHAPTSEGGYRVLIVDDNVGAAYMQSKLIQKLGTHRVQVVHDGPTALQAAAEFRPQMILLDIGLPEMNGYEVARRLRADSQFDSILLVAVTGYGAEEDRRRSFEAGFDLHLVKPPSIDSVRQLFTHPKLTRSATASGE